MKKYIQLINNEILTPSFNYIQELPWSDPILLTKSVFSHFSSDSLYRNSIFLMISSFILSFFGFLFWSMNARLYTTEQIGLATALISLVSLLSGLSTLGLNAGVIRYLPKQKNKNELMTTIFIIISFTAVIITIIYIVFLDIFSPKLLFISQNIYLLIFFIFLVILSALNLVKDSIFITYKYTQYGIAYNLLYSISRLILPLFLISFGAIGIFFSHSLGVIICILFAFWILYKKFVYKFTIAVNKKNLGEILVFSLGSYSANLIGGLPSSLFPIIILNNLGSKLSAYYYMDMMIIGFLYMIPISISQSLFAESSHKEEDIREFIVKSLRINLLVLIPSIIATIFLGKYVLLIFGQDYASEGLNFLRIMSVSALLVPINYSYGVYLRIRNRIKLINVVIILSTFITLVTSYLFVPYLGLFGIAAGLISGQISQIGIYFFHFLLYKK